MLHYIMQLPRLVRRGRGLRHSSSSSARGRRRLKRRRWGLEVGPRSSVGLACLTRLRPCGAAHAASTRFSVPVVDAWSARATPSIKQVQPRTRKISDGNCWVGGAKVAGKWRPGSVNTHGLVSVGKVHLYRLPIIPMSPFFGRSFA
jgi:hypothetical protein